MESRAKRQLTIQTESALAGAATLSLPGTDASTLVAVLTAAGDALRLDLPLPVELSRALDRQLSAQDIAEALKALAASVDEWTLPASAQGELDHGLEWALHRRDEVESVLLAARRILLPRGALVDATPEAETLRTAIAKHDLSCGRTLTRSRAERILHIRAELIDAHPWLDDIDWAEEAADDAPIAPLNPELASAVAPDLATMEGFIKHGRHQRRIEIAAAASPEVAEDLEDMVETYREQGVLPSLAAFRWLRARRGARTSPLSLHVPRIVERAAAADAQHSVTESNIELSLGALAPLDAVARLLVTTREVTLLVYPGDTAVKEVRFGGITAKPPESGNTWSVTATRESAEQIFVLHVVDELGRAFEESLTLQADA